MMASATENQSYLWPFPIKRKFEDQTLLIDIVKGTDDIESVLRLRHQVFKEELHCGESAESGLDQDAYDAFCDHLIITNIDTGEIVGTYRLLQRSVAERNIGFYSANEFDLSVIIDQKISFCETGRACIRQQYRGQTMINMLWLGLGRYADYYHIRYLGGCTTIGSKVEDAIAIYRYAELTDAIIEAPFNAITANPDNKIPDFKPQGVEINITEVKRSIPALLRGYFSLGIKLCPEPAYDPDFGVIDFFTIIDLETTQRRITRFTNG